MRSLVPKLVLAALVAATLPAAAGAHDCDHGDGRPQAAHHDPLAPPAWRDGYWRDGYWRDGYWRDGRRRDARWRERVWRERELAEIREELRQLDEQRADLYASGPRGFGRVRRFERWYAFRRAELERRWMALQQVAWR